MEIDTFIQPKQYLKTKEKVIKLVSKSTYDTHTEPPFKQLKILKFYDIFRFQAGKLMHVLV